MDESYEKTSVSRLADAQTRSDRAAGAAHSQWQLLLLVFIAVLAVDVNTGS